MRALEAEALASFSRGAQRIADQVTRYFVPAVVGTALVAFAGWWLAGNFPQGLLAFVVSASSGNTTKWAWRAWASLSNSIKRATTAALLSRKWMGPSWATARGKGRFMTIWAAKI